MGIIQQYHVVTEALVKSVVQLADISQRMTKQWIVMSLVKKCTTIFQGLFDVDIRLVTVA
ncbi:hypothetical protein C9J49_009565 [Halomonas sp. SL1]|nr:hypothetical protein C9J49_009565 [Halomonas sp. SL1]